MEKRGDQLLLGTTLSVSACWDISSPIFSSSLVTRSLVIQEVILKISNEPKNVNTPTMTMASR